MWLPNRMEKKEEEIAMESRYSLSPSHPGEPDLVLRLGSSPSQLGSGGFSLMPSPPVLAEPKGAVAAPELPLGEFLLSRTQFITDLC